MSEINKHKKTEKHSKIMYMKEPTCSSPALCTLTPESNLQDHHDAFRDQKKCRNYFSFGSTFFKTNVIVHTLFGKK